MAFHGFPNLKIELDDEVPALKDISGSVTAINGQDLEQVIEEVSGAGDDDDEFTPVGFLTKGEIVLTGPYEDTADGLVDCTLDQTEWDVARTLQLTFDGAGAAHVDTVETYIKKRSINPERGKLHAYSVTLQPTGAIT